MKKKKEIRSHLFRKENGITVFTGKVSPGFDFQAAFEEHRERRDLQIWLGISADEAERLFPGQIPKEAWSLHAGKTVELRRKKKT